MPDHVSKIAAHVRNEMAKAIIGQQGLVDGLLLVLLCSGHALVEGVPGLAKTLAVKTFSRILRLTFQRVQCTPDLMPADIIGTNVFHSASGEFSLRRGPIFTDLLLVDEINRTPPRTQSALLEAMEERQATLDGTRYPLSNYFTVFATQNPIEFEGTYPLPEAQLDRFLMKINVNYPELENETRILEHCHAGFDSRDLDRLNLVPAEPDALTAARAEVAAVRVEPALFRYVTQIVRRSRDWPTLTLGASPRAAVCLLFVARGVAAMNGRDYLLPDDVKQAAQPVLGHRLLLKPEADLEGVKPDQVIADLLSAVEVPK